MKIKELTQDIRNNSVYDLCWGTITNLKKIDNQADEYELRIRSLELEIEKLRSR